MKGYKPSGRFTLFELSNYMQDIAKNYPDAFKQTLTDATEQAKQDVINKYQKAVKVSVNSKLLSSLKTKIDTNPLKSKIWHDGKLENVRAKVIEGGAYIKPKNKPFLSFKIDGHWVRTYKSIRHDPNWVWKTTRREWAVKLPKMFLETVGRLVGG